jgi:hypothetical protein
MFRRTIPLALCALVLAVFGGAFASAKTVDSKSTKTQSCFKVAKLTEANPQQVSSADVCKAAKFVRTYVYSVGVIGVGDPKHHIKITLGPEHTVKTYEQSCDGPQPKYPPCEGTFPVRVKSRMATVKVASGAIKRVLVAQTGPGMKITFMPKKHGLHTATVRLTYDWYVMAKLELRVDAS